MAGFDLDAYLARIGFTGPASPDLQTLRALHRAHVLSVTFENLDVQLGVTLDLDVAAAFDKIVRRGRGGWCYEQNGLFGAALQAIGFEVERIGATVMRSQDEAKAPGDHLCLLVDVDGEPWLADVGFGGSLLEPLRLDRGAESCPPYEVQILRTEDGHLRFEERLRGGEPFDYDFRPGHPSEEAMAARCVELQTSPESSFVRNLVAQRRLPDEHWTLRGKVLRVERADGRDERVLTGPDDLVTTLRDRFALDLPQVGDLWPAIERRHTEVFGDS